MYKYLFSIFLFTPLIGLCDSIGISGKPDNHAPIGVMGEHNHKKG